MKEKYYYLRDGEKFPRVTVCVLKDNGEVARGIAIASFSEKEVRKGKRKGGRHRAKIRASVALNRKKTGMAIKRKRAKEVLASCKFYKQFALYDYKHKSLYMPTLTPFEKKLLGDK